MDRQTNNGYPLFLRIFIPLIFVLILQAAALLILFRHGGAEEHLIENAETLLYERVKSQGHALQQKMQKEWSNLSESQTNLAEIAETLLLEQGKGWDDLLGDEALSQQFLQKAVPELITQLRTGGTTGIFLVLNRPDGPELPAAAHGVYLRDTDPVRNSNRNADLELVRGLPALAKENMLSLDSFWEPEFHFSGLPDDPANRFYTRPIAQAKRQAGAALRYCSYWSPTFVFGEDKGHPIITYSTPLVNAKGQIYGVLGVDLQVDYLQKLLDPARQGQDDSFFVAMALTRDGGATYEKIAAGGIRERQFFSSTQTTLSVTPRPGGSFFTALSGRGDLSLFGAMLPLNLYGTNARFANESWAILGIEDQESLLAPSQEFMGKFSHVVIVVIALGVLAAIFAARTTIRPISRLTHALQNKDEDGFPILVTPSSSIQEINTLLSAVADLQADLSEESWRSSVLMESAGLAIGVFDHRSGGKHARCSPGLYQLLDIPVEDGRGRLDYQILKECLDELRQTPPIAPNVYPYTHNGKESFYSLVIREDSLGEIGAVLDVTAEERHRQQERYERSYDVLTGLWNRSYFLEQAHKLFESPETLGFAALLVLDIDDLQALNSNHGHEWGDDAIRSLALGLVSMVQDRVYIARRSGDEFYVLHYGETQWDTLKADISARWSTLQQRHLTLPDGSRYELRFSGGMALYPRDGQTLEELIHYADFSLYLAKHQRRGSLVTFDAAVYKEQSFLITGQQALTTLLSGRGLRFAYQPVISAAEGRVIGYELQMHSEVGELRTSESILKIARLQGKLMDVEHLIWHYGIQEIGRLRRTGRISKQHLLFVPSVSEQNFSPQVTEALFGEYADLIPSLVVEVSGRDADPEGLPPKLERLCLAGARLLIDGYGSSGSGELSLISTPASYVKLDVAFVRGLDVNPDKQLLLENLLQFAHSRKIRVVAGGVTVAQELAALIRMGVDQVQGAYLAPAKYEPEPLAPWRREDLLRMQVERPAAL